MRVVARLLKAVDALIGGLHRGLSRNQRPMTGDEAQQFAKRELRNELAKKPAAAETGTKPETDKESSEELT